MEGNIDALQLSEDGAGVATTPSHHHIKQRRCLHLGSLRQRRFGTAITIATAIIIVIDTIIIIRIIVISIVVGIIIICIIICIVVVVAGFCSPESGLLFKIAKKILLILKLFLSAEESEKMRLFHSSESGRGGIGRWIQSHHGDAIGICLGCGRVGRDDSEEKRRCLVLFDDR